MSRLPRLSSERVLRALQRLGFVEVRQRGSHVILKKEQPGGAVGCVVPKHRELAVGTLRGILKQGSVDEDDFLGSL